MIDAVNGSCSPNVYKKRHQQNQWWMLETGIYNQFIGRCKRPWGMNPSLAEILNLTLVWYTKWYYSSWKLWYLLIIVILWVHSFRHIMTTMSQTHQRNGIARRCAKGHRDVENAARAAEKNGPNVFPVCQYDEDISKIKQPNRGLRKYQSNE